MTITSRWTRLMKIHRSIVEPVRINPNWEERQGDFTQGLITSWERGREKSIEEPALASRALNGELVILPWRGGIEKQILKKLKYGAFNYLAMWQGLRGEDLSIDSADEPALTCTATKMRVVFTTDLTKFTEV
jgi:hypothetical protein